MSRLRVRRIGPNSGLSVTVGWENLREGVSHSQLAIEGFPEEGLPRVETSILPCMLGSRRERVVNIFIQQLGLIERGMSFRGKQPHSFGRACIASLRRSGFAMLSV